MRHVFLVVLASAAAPALAGAQGLGPRTLTPMHVTCAELPTSVAPSVPLTVAGADRADGRQSLGLGDVAVIRAGTAQGLALGQALVARRLDGGRAAFRRGREGYAGIRSAALLTIERIDERFALARVTRACDHVEVGDYLEPAVLPTLPAAPAAGEPDFGDRASILFGTDTREMFGDGDVLSINRGSSHGVTPGTTFALYRDPRNGLPLSELGDAVVVDVAETTSRAVVVRTRDAVMSGDVAVRRASAQP